MALIETKRRYTIRELNDEPEPSEWQQKVMEKIHVFEVGGASTCVFLDKECNVLKDHRLYNACIPIEYFEPTAEAEVLLGESLLRQGPNSKLFVAGKQCARDKYGDITDYTPVLQAANVESMREHLRAARKKRFPDNAFFREELETHQINKVFVELCKYPEISHELFTKTFFMALVGHEGMAIDSLTTKYSADEAAGYYSKKDNLMALTSKIRHVTMKRKAEMTRFDDLVAEEILHALDQRAEDFDRALSDDVSSGFISTLEKHTKKLSGLLERWKREVSEHTAETYTTEENCFRNTLLAYAESQMEGELKLSLPWRGNKTETALKMLEKYVTQLKEAHSFTKHKIYADLDDDGVRAELFAKLAKHLLLNRYNYQIGDANLYRAVEEFVYVPRDDAGRAVEENPFGGLMALLDKRKAQYLAATTPEERQQSTIFAEHIAKNVEKWSPGSTGYIMDYASIRRC
jgi:hypothetical protein